MIRLKRIIIFLIVLYGQTLFAQEITFNEQASLEQVYSQAVGADNPVPMNDLNLESGYVLYQAEITTRDENETLEVANVRDYAAVYVNGLFQGKVTENQKKVALKVKPGNYLLQIYVENIGRITYGPEITDNSKGLFGEITLNGQQLRHWKMIPLNIRNYPMKKLVFHERNQKDVPRFYKGTVELNKLKNNYLDITGWGMGEVWVNEKYAGSYWEEEKQRSILIPAESFVPGKNEIVVFELKNHRQKTMKLGLTPVF